MSNITLTPLVEQEAVKLSGSNTKWRKQVLPKGKFDYKGETIDFDAIGLSAKKAFDAKAMDQVSFQLADGGNNHNFDPKNFRGEVEAVELADDGVYVTLDFEKFPDMQAMVEKNPKFGVSAQIERDNKDHPFVFSHVLGTLNPRVKGMKPWEKLELSETSDDVLDLTDIDLSEGGDKVGKDKDAATTTLTLNADQVKWIEENMASDKALQDALGAAKLSDTEGDNDNPAIKLANETASNALRLARESQKELAIEKWKNTVSELTRDGVPPVALSAAESLMKLPKSGAIKLADSDEEAVDPQAIVLSVLESLKGTIDLSVDKGHNFNDSESTDKEYEAFKDSFMRDLF